MKMKITILLITSLVLNMILAGGIIFATKDLISSYYYKKVRETKEGVYNLKLNIAVKVMGKLKNKLERYNISLAFDNEKLSDKQVKYLNSKGFKYLTAQERADKLKYSLPEEEEDTEEFTINFFVGTTTRGYEEICMSSIKGKTSLNLNMKMFGAEDEYMLEDKRSLLFLSSYDKANKIYFDDSIKEAEFENLVPFFNKNRNRKRLGLDEFIFEKSYLLTASLTKEELEDFIMRYDEVDDVFNNVMSSLYDDGEVVSEDVSNEATEEIIMIEQEVQSKEIFEEVAADIIEEVAADIIEPKKVQPISNEEHIQKLLVTAEKFPEEEEFIKTCLKFYGKDIDALLLEDIPSEKMFCVDSTGQVYTEAEVDEKLDALLQLRSNY